MKRANILRALGLSLAISSPAALAQTVPTISADAQAALKLAEEIWPDLFSGGIELRYHAALGYAYRYYANTGVYVGFKGGEVFVKGPQFGPDIYSKGTERTVLAKLEQIKIGNSGGCNEQVTGQLGCGDWDIKISGTVASTIFGQTTIIDFDEVLIEDVDLDREPTSEEQIEDVMTEYFEDVGTITNLEVVIVSQSDTRVVMDVAFDATITQQGVTVKMSYDLRYDMTKN